MWEALACGGWFATAKYRKSWITSPTATPAATATGKDRFKENSDRMRTGSLLEVAGVLKNLMPCTRPSRSLFREKKML